MGITFNAEEILEIAEQIERNGGKFYQKAAQNIKENENARRMFLELAKMEQQHEESFKQMRESLIDDNERQQIYYDPDDENSLYLAAMADGSVFDHTKDPSAMLQGDETASDILSMAIGLEKDSVVFYLGIKEAVPSVFGKDRVDQIIKEEMSHITLLAKQLAALKE
jgi:rubrerythrin